MAFKIKLAGIGFQVNGIYEESLKIVGIIWILKKIQIIRSVSIIV